MQAFEKQIFKKFVLREVFLWNSSPTFPVDVHSELCILQNSLLHCLKWPLCCCTCAAVVGWLSSRHGNVVSLCRGCCCCIHLLTVTSSFDAIPSLGSSAYILHFVYDTCT